MPLCYHYGDYNDFFSLQSAGSQKKRYGIDAKNDTYKPGGGNVRIFNEKMTTKGVGSRIDAKSTAPPPREGTGSPGDEHSTSIDYARCWGGFCMHFYVTSVLH